MWDEKTLIQTLYSADKRADGQSLSYRFRANASFGASPVTPFMAGILTWLPEPQTRTPDMHTGTNRSHR